MWKMDEHDSFMDKLLFQMVDFLHSNVWINCPCMDTFSHYGKMLFFGGITHLLAMFGGVYPWSCGSTGSSPDSSTKQPGLSFEYPTSRKVQGKWLVNGDLM